MVTLALSCRAIHAGWTVKPFNTLTVASVALLVFGFTCALHEVAHAIVGSLLGAELSRIYINSVVWTDFSAVVEGRLIVYSMSGPFMNVMLAWIGYELLTRTQKKTTTVHFLQFLFFTTNACTAVSYLTVAPLLGFGDWMDLARMFPNQILARGLLTTVGALASWTLYLIVSREFSRLMSNAPSYKIGIAFGISWRCYLTMITLGMVTGLLSPLPLENLTEILLSFGTGLQACWILLFAAGRVTSVEFSGPTTPWTGIGPSFAWYLTGAIATAVFVLGFGLGVPL